MNPFIEKFQITPPDFSACLKTMFCSDPITAVKELNSLIEDMFVCIESNPICLELILKKLVRDSEKNVAKAEIVPPKEYFKTLARGRRGMAESLSTQLKCHVFPFPYFILSAMQLEKM